jgi:hypothetical protein
VLRQTEHIEMKIIGYLTGVMIVLCSVILAFPHMITGAANDYFDYTYKVELAKSQVQVNETFTARVHTEGICKQSLPVTVNQANITGKIIARLQGKDTEIELNSNFLLQIKNIPSQAGQAFQKDIDVPLVFPESSPPGIYDVIARTTGAQFEVFGFSIDGLAYMPTEPVTVGRVECLNKQTPVTSISSTVTPSLQVVEKTNSTGNLAWPVAGGAAGAVVILGIIVWRTFWHVRKK